MRPILHLALATLSVAALAGPALAQTLSVPIDQAVRVDIAGQVNSVVIANPSLVDVRIVDSHTLYLVGNGYGATNVVALDRDGRSIYSSEVVVSSPNAGRVSVYRGAARTDMACTSNCQVSMRSAAASSGGGGGGGGAGAGAPAPDGPAGALAQALGADGTP